MNAGMFTDLATRAMAAAPWPDPRFPPSPYYRFLKLLAQNVQPSLSVELGVCGGGASFHMAQGWPKGTVVGVEHAVGSPHERDNWLHIQAECPNWVLWKGDSVESAAAIARKYGRCALIFVDTTHTYEQTVAEWNAWEPFLAGRAVVCLDDLNRMQMDGLWDWIPWAKVRLDMLHDGGLDADGYGDGGFGVAWR